MKSKSILKYISITFFMAFCGNTLSANNHGMEGITIAAIDNTAIYGLLKKGDFDPSALRNQDRRLLVTVYAGGQGYLVVLSDAGMVECLSWLNKGSEDSLVYGEEGAYSGAKLCKEVNVKKVKKGKLEISRNGKTLYAKIFEELPIEAVNYNNFDLSKFSINNLSLGTDIFNSQKIASKNVKREHRLYSCASCPQTLKILKNIPLDGAKYTINSRLNAIFGPSITGSFNGNAIVAYRGFVQFRKDVKVTREIAINDILSRYGKPSNDRYEHSSNQFKASGTNDTFVWAFDREGKLITEDVPFKENTCNPNAFDERIQKYGYAFSTGVNGIHSGKCGLVLVIKLANQRRAGGDVLLANSYQVELFHSYHLLLARVVNELSFVNQLRDEYRAKVK